MHRRSVDDTLSAVRPTAEWVDAILIEAGIGDEPRHDLHVCLEEALANLIMHGRPRGDAKHIAVEVSAGDGEAVLTISDRCQPFDVTNDALVEASAAHDENRVGGNGLRLLRALAGDISYASSDEGNVLRLRFGAPAPDMAYAAIVRRIPAFAKTPDDALETLLTKAQSVTFAENDRILAQGEASEFALIITSGEVAVVNESQHGEAPVARIAAPALIGEIGALARLPRTAGVRALTSVRALKINRDALFLAGRHYPEMLVSVISQLGQQVQSINTALGLYAAGLSALERDDFDASILADLTNPTENLRNFASAFQRLAHRVTEERRSRAELASAGVIQRAMLPPPLDKGALADRCDVHAVMKSARGVGGDLFDLALKDENRLVLVVGDVCGKGIPASLYMSSTLTVLRLAAQHEQDIAALMGKANDALCAHNDTTMFVTLFYGVLDLSSGRLDYVNCGHNAPYVLRRDGSCEELPSRGAPLGFFPGQRWEADSVQLERGEGVFLFTDGVSEAMNPQNEEYGETRLIERLTQSRAANAEQLVEAVIADVVRFAGEAEQSDDITCLAALMPRD